MRLEIKYRIAVWLIDLVSITWRIRINGKIPAKPAIIAFWHGKMLPAWKFFGKFGANAIVSKSKDGEILTALLEKWGFRVVRGSSSKGGREALQEIVDFAPKGYFLITPDGPQGPRNKMKAGAVVASQRSGVKLVLCGVDIRSKYIFEKSWDKFQFPLPFSKIILNLSEEITIDTNLNRKQTERIIEELNQKLNNLDN